MFPVSYLIVSGLVIFFVITILTKLSQESPRDQPRVLVKDGYQHDREYPAAEYPRPTGLNTHGGEPRQRDSLRTGALGTSMSPTGMDQQYSNGSVNIRDEHPVLAYQMMHDKAINPANIGDPIRIPDVAGPAGMYGGVSSFVDSLTISRGSVPVPMGALKQSSERYNRDMFRFSPLARGTVPSAMGGPTLGGSPPRTTPSGFIPDMNRPLSSGDYLRPYGPNIPVDETPFFGSVNAYAPFPEITTPWEKAGILTSMRGEKSEKQEILNLFRRPIAPLQDLWEYQVQDKNGFVIKLEEKYLENADVVHHVIGKNGEGPWKVHIFVQNKYIWV